MQLVGDHDVEQAQPLPPTSKSDDSDQTPSLITIELDLVQAAFHPYSLRPRRQANLCERALERAELLTITVCVDQYILDKLVQLTVRPRPRHSITVDRSKTPTIDRPGADSLHGAPPPSDSEQSASPLRDE